MLFVVGMVMAIVQGGLIGKLKTKFGDKKLIMARLLIQAFGFILFILAPTFWMIYLFGGIISAGFALRSSTMYSLFSKNVSKSEQGEIFGVSTSLFALMNVLGPLFAGLVYDQIMPSAPYWIGAILFIIAFILMDRVKEKAELEANKSV